MEGIGTRKEGNVMKKTMTITPDKVGVKTTKKCFVICPIGDGGTPTRRRSDLILKHIIKPVVEELGYTAVRSDDISAPGVITSQIIQHLVEDELVAADLTDGNPNVYYELAVRHMSKRPVVQMIHTGQKPSFDVTVQRTISFDYQDLESVENCKKQLKDQIRTVEADPTKVDSPISQGIDILDLSKSKVPMEQWMAKVMRMLERISAEVCEEDEPRTEVSRIFAERLKSLVDKAEPRSPKPIDLSEWLKRQKEELEKGRESQTK